MKPGTKVTITTPPFAFTSREDVVGHVARVVADGAGRGMREDDRRAGDAQGVGHRVGRDVAQVDEHAEPVHLEHDLLAELREPAQPRRVGGGVGPRHVVAVGQGHVPGAERVHHAQRPERVVDRVAPFHAQQRGDPAGLDDALDVGGGARHLERIGVARDHAVHQVDLLEHRPDRGLPLE